jgi:tetratricopeptide (TPR) repeat protein
VSESVVRNCAAVQSSAFNIAQTLQDALSLHQQGRLREAEKLYARALKAAPNNFDALHLLGLIKAQSGQMGEAHRLMSSALRINPTAPDAIVNFANVLHVLKSDAEALVHLDPDAAAGRSGSAALSRVRWRARSPTEALACFDGAARNPRTMPCQSRHGARAAGRYTDAPDSTSSCARRATSKPNNRGRRCGLERPEQALAAFDPALPAAPQHVSA